MLPNRTVNLRFLVWFLAVGVLQVLGVYAVHAFHLRRNVEFLQDEATKAEDRGQYAEAAKFYQLILGYLPDDARALKAYGQALDKADPSRAARWKVCRAYEKVLLKQPDEHEVRRQLIDIALGLREYSEARDHLRELLEKVYTNPDRLEPSARQKAAELEQLLAFCLNILGEPGGDAKYPDAATLYERAITHDPHLPTAYVQYAELKKDPADKDKDNCEA